MTSSWSARSMVKTDYIVTADNDLLSLGEIESIPIVDVPRFWRRLTELD